MTQEGGLGRGAGRAPSTAYPWRRSHEATQVSVLVLSLVVVFLLSIAHDEIVAHAVAQGWLAETRAEWAEIALGLGLFLVWGALTVALVDLVRRQPGSGSRREQDVAAASAQQDEPKGGA